MNLNQDMHFTKRVNNVGLPCRKRDSKKVQEGLNHWKTKDKSRKPKTKEMSYWEVMSQCTAL